jgi:hypothetical protein
MASSRQPMEFSKHNAEVVEALGGGGVIGAQARLTDRQGALEEGAGGVEVAAAPRRRSPRGG